MHIVFVNYYSLACNSGGHILNLAREITTKGVGVTIFVPSDAEALPLLSPSHNIQCINFANIDLWLKQPPSSAKDTLLVAWTPRENVRNFVEKFRQRFACRYLVHLEDNELLITATNLGIEIDAIGQIPRALLDAKIPNDSSLSHPVHFTRFVAQAHGATSLLKGLFDIIQSPVNRLVFWPGATPAFFKSGSVDYSYRQSLGIKDSELVLALSGLGIWSQYES